jgi:cytochrome c-type biogenesis protein CcmH/NrfG
VDAITGEPEEWRLYFMQALVFQQAAARSPEYVARSRELVDTAIGLAPMRVEVNRLLVRQAIVERDMGSAQEALDFYLALNPNAARHFMEMVAVLMRQYIAQGDLADAQGALDSYLKLDPVSAPSFSELALDLVRRYISEQDFTRAQTALEGYLALNPAAAAAFQVSRDEIESAIKTQSAAGE